MVSQQLSYEQLLEENNKLKTEIAALRNADAENSLRLLTEALDSVPALVSFISKDGVYRYNNKAYEDWFGTKKGELTGRRVEDVIGTDRYKTTKPFLDRAFSGERITRTVSLHTSQQEMRDVEVSFIPHQNTAREYDGCFVFLNDISDRLASESALAESKKRFGAFFENAPSMMYAKDLDLNLALANAYYLKFHGKDKTEAFGKKLGPRLDADTRRRLEFFDRKVISEKTDYNVECTFTSASGEQFEHTITKFPIFGLDGEVTAVGGVNSDISQLRNRERELELAKKAAEEAAEQARSANSAKSQFLATMSHEIRTPMNGVLGMAAALSRSNLDSQQAEFVNTITESGHALLGLLNDILDLSKIEAGQVDLEEQ